MQYQGKNFGPIRILGAILAALGIVSLGYEGYLTYFHAIPPSGDSVSASVVSDGWPVPLSPLGSGIAVVVGLLLMMIEIRRS